LSWCIYFAVVGEMPNRDRKGVTMGLLPTNGDEDAE
jgi:hypothetical protein